MTHEIETHGSQAAAVFARKDAWHRLGTTVRDRAFTAEEAMRLGHLGGWDVRKLPLTTAEVSEGGVTPIEVPGFATVRTNPFTGQPEALGVVGGGYTPLQNEDHADFLNLLADESGAIFDTAGSLRGGRKVFITMQLPDSLTVGGTDRVERRMGNYLRLTGDGATLVIGARKGTHMGKRWDGQGFAHGPKRQHWHIDLDRRALVHLEYHLAARGGLTARPAS